MSLAGLVQRHRATVLVATAMLTVAGLYSLATLPAGIYPEVSYPRVIVVAKSPGFEANEMTVAVTRPIDEAMAGLIGLRKIRSRTVRSGGEINLDFAPNTDMWLALQQVQARLATLKGSLPPDIDLVAERMTTSVFPVLQYELTGADPITLQDIARFTIRPRLTVAPDVGQVEIQGGDEREVTVALDAQRLIANHVSATDVTKAISATDLLGGVGRSVRQYREYGIVVGGLTTTPAAVGAVVIRQTGDRPLRVADVADVSYGRADKYQLIRGNGEAAALINVSRQPGGNILRLEAGADAIIDSIRPLLPKGVRISTVYDQGALVRESLVSVRDAILVGGVLAVIVLLIFLGDLRLTLAASLTLPLALVGAFAGMDVTGGSLNLMSLGGLAVAIGLVIDDAVVVVENVARRLALHPSEPVGEVIRRGTDEIFAPVLSSTVTTVVVFTPLGLVEGVVGQFFKAFSIALAIAVALSLVLAVTIIPLLAEWWLARGKGAHTVQRRWRDPLAGVLPVYRRLLERLLARPSLAVAGVAVLVVATLGLYRVVGSGFLPEMDEGGFILDYWAPPISSLPETDRQVGLIEAVLRRDPAVQAFSRRTGAEMGMFATAPSRGDITVLLRPRRERHASVYEVMDRVRDSVNQQVPAVRVEFVQLLQDNIGDLAGAPKPIELKLFTTDHQLGEATAVRIAAALDGVDGLEDLFNGVPGNNVETRVDVDPVRAARLGLTPADVLEQAEISIFGRETGTAREADRLIPIRVHLADAYRGAADVAATLPIVGPVNWAPLGMVGRVRDTTVASELLREDLRPVIKVTGRNEGASLGDVMRDIRERLDTVALPAGVRLEYGGQDAAQRASFRQLLLVSALAVGAVLLVMVMQFGEVRGPIGLVLAAPLGLAGALAGLAATGIPFNVASFMGLILLIGLVVKNGILLIDAAHGLRKQGLAPREALIEAGMIRFRPILMTTLCTIAGLFPLALGLGAGAELQRPLAVAVIGGLSVSTIVTLLLLPVGLEAAGTFGGPSGLGISAERHLA